LGATHRPWSFIVWSSTWAGDVCICPWDHPKEFPQRGWGSDLFLDWYLSCKVENCQAWTQRGSMPWSLEVKTIQHKAPHSTPKELMNIRLCRVVWSRDDKQWCLSFVSLTAHLVAGKSPSSPGKSQGPTWIWWIWQIPARR
jgi:hypothetical protein